ncbi:hypothetical protein [Aurantibacillus circumpalustris]|uniref:hypothetical protein n=1 Tax=Aurantibacillus circumpalustris TaxID=3036359 RepID=UPI00295ADB30|nr:hypothetical protein [Aurantibacillus circumpalustris]
MKTPLFLVKIFRYEYWPWGLFYLPVLPYWVYLSLRNKSFAYFSVANPGIELGGFYGESKSEILSLINKRHLPKSISAAKGIRFEEIKSKLQLEEIEYPIIAKPDVGERGNDVCKINNENELITYHNNSNFFYIIQEYIDYDFEFGVLYSRMPDSTKGVVSSVTLKEFLSVVGDGKSSILELMKKSTRARFQINRFKKEMGDAIHKIPLLNEKVLLEPIGNHCRGTRFINFNHIINQNLHEVFDEISLPINGFYYGRFDLKAKSVEDLQKGISIKIMELNGASSEPGHIYDSDYTLINAYKDLLAHWKRLADISAMNIKKGEQAVSFKLIAKSYLKFVLLK